MKKIFVILALCAALQISCNKESFIFDRSASERIVQTLDDYRSALMDGRTWVMEYYPDPDQSYGGWIYIVEFRDELTVKAWFEGSTFMSGSNLTLESEYAIDFSTGPMLRFSTNNDYLHYFALPGTNGYQGLRGDYEFTLMSLSPMRDRIELRGIKTGNRITMSPLSDEYTPESYLTAVRNSQLAVNRKLLKVIVNDQQIGTIERTSTAYLYDFAEFAASKRWTLRYSYEQPAFDEQGLPIFETVEVSDFLSVIHLPGSVMKLYEPYIFKGDAAPFLKDQTMREFEWRLGVTSADDSYTCTDSFMEIKFVP
ncbi:hypothetical protein FACS1894159_09540 [Bacteroidia bacterium]|nr:hypothetical protein FACS1894159_09540 [Bacteroidia bacterium]